MPGVVGNLEGCRTRPGHREPTDAGALPREPPRRHSPWARRDIRVCFAGDSFVAGTGDDTALGWVGRVTAAGIAGGLRLTSYNLGVRGATSVQVARRLAIEARPRLTTAEDPRIIVSFGVNDTLPGRRSRRADDRRGAGGPSAHGAAPTCWSGRPRSTTRADRSPPQARRGARRRGCLLGIPFVPALAATEAHGAWRYRVHAGDGFHPDARATPSWPTVVTPPILAWPAPDRGP